MLPARKLLDRVSCQIGDTQTPHHSVEQAHPVKHDGGAHRAKDHVFYGGLGAFAVALVESDDGIARQRSHLDPQHDHQQIRRADHQDHAQGASQEQDKELGRVFLRAG